MCQLADAVQSTGSRFGLATVPLMSSPYVVVVVHRDHADFASEVCESLRRATGEILLQPDLVEFRDALVDVDLGANAAVVYLGSRAASTDDDIHALLTEALDRQIPIMPLVRASKGRGVQGELSPSIRRLNVADWDSQRGQSLAALLGMLGLVEHERKVFISYRQSESTPLASQLHTELARSRFDVFLDRYSVAPGEDFQRKLDQELEEIAFMLLIESPELRESLWVQHEIAYAHSHRIGVLALTLPDVADGDLVMSIDEAFRIRLTHEDLNEQGELTEDRLRHVVVQIELAHARALRRRREQLLGSVRDKLFQSGYECEPIDDWAVLATRSSQETAVFLVTPRCPRPVDLYDLHCLHGKAVLDSGNGVAGALVHDVEQVGDRERQVLAWMTEDRPYQSVLLHDWVLSGGGGVMASLADRHVFLSASFPSGQRAEDVRPFDAAAIADAVTAVVRSVLLGGGKLLFGGHPTITPIVLLIGNELGVRHAVDIFQSEWFREELTDETVGLIESGVGEIHWTPARPTREASLGLMRERMLKFTQPAGAVFIGGMSGIRDEYAEFARACPGVPRFPLIGPGGAAAQLSIEERELPANMLERLRSRHYPFVASQIVASLETRALN